MNDEDNVALIIHREYAEKILNGEKKWELRKRPTKKRGKIYIMSKGKVLGSVEIIDVKGPFTVKELEKHYDKHRASREDMEKISQGKKLYALVLRNPRKLRKEVKLKYKRGARVWRKLSREEIREIRKYETEQ